MERLEGRALLTTAGNVDPTFGTHGFYDAPLSSPFGGGLTAVSTGSPDGNPADFEIVAAGAVGSGLGVIKLTKAGLPDPSFGTDGQASLPVPSNATAANLTAVALTANNDVTVVGFIQIGTPGSLYDRIVARFLPDGTLDPSFGTDGVVNLDPQTIDAMTFTPEGVALRPDGSVVVVGSAQGTAPLSTPAIIMLGADGSVDSTFGTDGLVLLPGNPISADAASIQANGQIFVVAAPYLAQSSDQDSFTTDIYRLNPDGSLAGATISTGLASVESVYAEADGNILVSGSTNGLPGRPSLERYNVAGSLVTAVTPSGFGRILGEDPATLDVQYGDQRFNHDLTPDLAYGDLGTAAIRSSPISTSDFPFDAQALAPDGSLIAAAGESRVDRDFSEIVYPSNVITRLSTTATPAAPGDFTGDGLSDPAVFLSGTATYVVGNSSGGASQVVQLGAPGLGNTIPAPGDYDATGQQDLASYIVQTGYWAIKDPTGQTPGVLFPFGQPGRGNTLPAPGDYYGVGADQVAVYLAQSGIWSILAPGLKPGLTFPFGQPGVGNTIPVSGDYFGAGSDQVAVYLPQFATWSILLPGLKSAISFQFGIPGAGNSIPMPGDYDGSGGVEPAVYLPSLAEVQYISAAGKVVTIPFGIPGTGQTLPAPGDYDGSGKTEVAAYFPSSNLFIDRPASGGADEGFPVGFAAQGPILPVTATVPLILAGDLPSPGVSASSISILGQPDPLDFVPQTPAEAAKKAKA